MIELKRKEKLNFDIEFLGTKILNYGVTCKRANKYINNTVLLTDICCEHQRVVPNISIHENHKILILIFFLDQMKYSELLNDQQYCHYLDKHYLNSTGEHATIESFSALCKEYISKLFNSTIGQSYFSLENNVKNNIYVAAAIWYFFYRNKNIIISDDININVDISNATKGIKYAESIVPMLLAMTNNYQLKQKNA